MKKTLDKERFEKNLNLLHLAYVCDDENMIKRIMNGILAFFPNDKYKLEHFCFFCNFGLLEGHEQTPEELYNELIEKL